MIVNIWTKLEDLTTYVRWIAAINTDFAGKIYSWKPSSEIKERYMYMSLVDNSHFVKTSNETLKKRATIDFVLFGVKGESDVDLYNSLDLIVNELVTECVPWIDIWAWFLLHAIEEGNQSWIVYEKKRPFLQGEFFITYKSKY